VKDLDPRTKLALGLMAIAAALMAHRAETVLLQCAAVLLALLTLRLSRVFAGSMRLMCPTLCFVFVIGVLSFGLETAALLTLRLFNLLTISFIFFHGIPPEEMGDALKKIGIPYDLAFILTTGMRYVPLMGQKLHNIMDAQQSRGIDLRLRLRNASNFFALLMPMLVQSLLLADELAIAMETRGFHRTGRSSRRHYRLKPRDYGCMAGSLILFVLFCWWEIGGRP